MHSMSGLTGSNLCRTYFPKLLSFFWGFFQSFHPSLKNIQQALVLVIISVRALANTLVVGVEGKDFVTFDMR